LAAGNSEATVTKCAAQKHVGNQNGPKINVKLSVGVNLLMRLDGLAQAVDIR
jgi:hypothetical protein